MNNKNLTQQEELNVKVVVEAYPSIRDQNYEFLSVFISFVINFTMLYYLFDYLKTIFYGYEIVIGIMVVSFITMFILLNKLLRYLNIFYKSRSSQKFFKNK